MVTLAKRVMVRPLAISLVLASILGLGLFGQHRNTKPVNAQQADRISVVLRWWDAEGRGDLDTSVAQFAANAVFVGTGPTAKCPNKAPCTDLAGIRQQIQGNIAKHDCTTLRAIQVTGAVVTGQREIRADDFRANGVERIVQAFIFVVPQDTITFFAGAYDLADPQTALRVAIVAGTEPAGTPLPNPDTPCAGVS